MLVHCQGIFLPCLVFCVIDVSAIPKQQISGSLEHLAFVDVLFHIILHSPYIVKFVIHQLYDMKMVKHVYGIRAVVKNRANESCGQICCYIFD